MTILKVVLSGSLVSILAAEAPAQVLIYSNDFEGPGPVGSEWSDTSTDTTPGTVQHPADKFLGQFGSGTVTLTLTDLPPAHTEVTVAFDLFVIRSWDGNGKYGLGPDEWNVGVEGVGAFNTTFSNWSGTDNQAFPDEYPGGDNPPRTGAIENNTLGYEFDDNPQDAVYHASVPFAHTASTLVVTFSATGLQELTDESWGLDDVVIQVDIPEPATVFLLALGGLVVSRRR